MHGALEFIGEDLDGLGDARGLLAEGGHHALGGVGFVADQLHGGDDEREMIVDVMAHGGELAVQLADLLDGQSDWLTGHEHGRRCAKDGGKGKRVSGAFAV